MSDNEKSHYSFLFDGSTLQISSIFTLTQNLNTQSWDSVKILPLKLQKEKD